MKNLFLFLLIIVTNNLLAQSNPIDSTGLYPDFSQIKISTNQEDSEHWARIKRIDTIAMFFAGYDNETDKEIVSDGQLISSRRYFPNSKLIYKEFIKVNKNRYHYLENDSLNNNRLLAEGDFIISDTIFIKIDTISIVDTQTYEQVKNIIAYPKLLKEGEWFEADSVFIYRGNYKNNKREGKWVKFKRIWEYDERDLVYKNDSLISETQLNLVKVGDINAIKKALIGTWGTDQYGLNNDSMQMFKKNIKNFDFKFNPDGSFKYFSISCGSGSPQKVEINKNNWVINDKLIIEININESNKAFKMYYQLLSLKEEEMVLKILKN